MTPATSGFAMAVVVNRVFALDVKADAASAGRGSFEGYGSIFGNVDSYGDVVMPGAFAASLREHRAAGTWPAMLFNHDHNKPVGEWLSIDEDTKGLYVKGRLWVDGDRPDPDAEKVHRVMTASGGARMGLSIGYRTRGYRDHVDGKVELTELDLLEVSPVMFPANALARVTQVKSDIGSIRDFECFLREAGGYSRSEARTLALKGFSGLAGALGASSGGADTATADPREEEAGAALVALLKRNTHILTGVSSR